MFSPGSSLMPVWFTNLACSSTDSCISECNTCPSVATPLCSHDQDVTVQCCKYITMLLLL